MHAQHARPTNANVTPGVLSKDAGSNCTLELPHYGSGVCPGPECKSFQDFWSLAKFMAEHFPKYTQSLWPKTWQDRAVQLKDGCFIQGWQDSPVLSQPYCPT